MEIEQFVEETEDQLRKLMDNVVTADLKAVESNLTRLQKIQKLLSVQKYKLVFIGNTGSGKTTTICHYLNLAVDNPVGKRFANIELFDIGKGKTTACEVHYRVGDQTMFKLVPMDETKQKAIIRDYCEYVWRKAFPDSGETEYDTPSDSNREHDRIIRNMLGVASDKEMVETLLRDYSQQGFVSFFNDMLKTARLDERTRTSVAYDKSAPAKEWVKKTFSDINKGKAPDVSIPERVDVFFNPQDIEINLPDNVSEIIDTRGFEGNAREDLVQYLKANDTLSILMDKPEEVPGANQKKILSDWIDSGDKDVIPRISLLVNLRDGDLENVNEADGSATKGEEIKREEISRTVDAEHLNYYPQNTLFLNPCEGIYIKQPRKKDKVANSNKSSPIIEDIDEDERRENSEKVTAHINAVIDRFHAMLEQEAVEIEDRTEKLMAKISVPSRNKQYAVFLENAARSLEVLRTGLIGSEDDEGRIYEAFADFESDFFWNFRYESRIHWNSARKTAFMVGTWDNAQIYDELSLFVRRTCRRLLEPVKNQALHYLREGEFEDLRPFLASCRNKADKDYLDLLDRIKENAHTIMVDAFTRKSSALEYHNDSSILAHGDLACWTAIQNTPGGKDYYTRLLNAFRKRMARKKVADDIMNMVEDEVNHFFDSILDILKQKISEL